MEAVERLRGRDGGQSICNGVSLRKGGAIDRLYVRDEGEGIDASWLAMVERVGRGRAGTGDVGARANPVTWRNSRCTA
jgi:hypothetical protein